MRPKKLVSFANEKALEEKFAKCEECGKKIEEKWLEKNGVCPECSQ